MRMVGITGDKELSSFPGVRTFGEDGFEYLDAVRGWFGLAAPLKTPQGVIHRMNTEINSIAKQPDFVAELTKSGQVPSGGTPEHMTAYMKRELDTWSRVVREAKVELQ
jgi:tripartite-type tricarboxylate transporter receptor subunit TctC